MQENIKGIRFCHTLKTGGQETYPFYSNSLFETNLTEAEYSSHPSPLVSPSAIPSTVPLRCALAQEKHTDTGLSDTAADCLRESAVQNRFLEGKLRAGLASALL